MSGYLIPLAIDGVFMLAVGYATGLTRPIARGRDWAERHLMWGVAGDTGPGRWPRVAAMFLLLWRHRTVNHIRVARYWLILAVCAARQQRHRHPLRYPVVVPHRSLMNGREYSSIASLRVSENSGSQRARPCTCDGLTGIWAAASGSDTPERISSRSRAWAVGPNTASASLCR
jgi:hypothetical protein